jgi:hypothetical protein
VLVTAGSSPVQNMTGIKFLDLIAGIASLTAAFLIAWLFTVIYQLYANQPELAVSVILFISALIIFLAVGLILFQYRKKLSVVVGIWAILIAVAVICVAIYFFWVKDLVIFPADILIWSESDFINDILKLRIGYPLYTDQVNNESFVYPPGSQLLTYGIASLLGQGVSIPIYRAIQILYTIGSAVLATASSVLLVRIVSPNIKIKGTLIWALGVPFMFLFATNPITNPFIHNLHNDSLAVFISALAFYFLVRHIYHPTRWLMICMAILPAAGFMVKQNLAVWAVFYSAYFLFFTQPRLIRRAFYFAFLSFLLIAGVYGIAWLLYGENFHYWVIYVLGAHGISPLRSFEHFLDTWLYLILGFVGGLYIVKDDKFRKLIGPWIIWLGFILLEIYTSGVAWMINHIGPGSLLAGVWFLPVLVLGLPRVLEKSHNVSNTQLLFRACLLTCTIVLVYNGLGFIRIPEKPLPKDTYRYIGQIEAAFIDIDKSTVLLDAGSWVYFTDGVVMKDRAPSIGERGYSQTGDFSELIKRIEEQYYQKIILRNLHDPNFWYDHFLWENSSGIREALLKYYYEIDNIEAVAGDNNYLFGEISVLVPLPR